jgi:hypothetical protein
LSTTVNRKRCGQLSTTTNQKRFGQETWADVHTSRPSDRPGNHKRCTGPQAAQSHPHLACRSISCGVGRAFDHSLPRRPQIVEPRPYQLSTFDELSGTSRTRRHHLRGQWPTQTQAPASACSLHSRAPVLQRAPRSPTWPGCFKVDPARVTTLGK